MNALQLFKCLADDTRLKSVVLIHTFGEACVCELMETLKLDQPKTSRHLASLRKCNILLDERRGKWVYYRLHPDLPAWAKSVIASASESNCENFEALLATFKQCQLNGNDCCN